MEDKHNASPRNCSLRVDDFLYRKPTAYYRRTSKWRGTIRPAKPEAVYEYQTSTNQNTLYLTLGGVTITCDLISEETAPISDAEQEQLEAWGASEEGNLVRDASVAIIQEGTPQSPSQLLLNYYAIALLVDSIPATASGPRLDSSQKNALHHAASKLRPPDKPTSAPCTDPKSLHS